MTGRFFCLSVSLCSDKKRQKYASARLYTAFIPFSRTAERVNNILLTALLKLDVLTLYDWLMLQSHSENLLKPQKFTLITYIARITCPLFYTTNTLSIPHQLGVKPSISL